MPVLSGYNNFSTLNDSRLKENPGVEWRSREQATQKLFLSDALKCQRNEVAAAAARRQ